MNAMPQDTTAERRAWRNTLKRKVCSRTDFANNPQYVHTPYDLCHDMLERLDQYGSLHEAQTFLTFNLEFVEVLCYTYGIEKSKVWFVTECLEKAAVALRHPRYAGINVVIDNYLTWRPNMKFDIIVGNPPYNAAQENDGKRGGGATLWQEFVKKSILLLTEGGYLCMVHPCGWRGIGKHGKFSEVQSLLLSKQIKYLEIHGAMEGFKTFGVGTRYDWYVLQNKSVADATTIKGEDGKTYQANLTQLPFIPNGMFEELFALVAKDGEDRVEIIADSSYHTQGKVDSLSRDKKNGFKYPVICSLKKDGLNLIYSNTNENGHFGIPKVIFGRGQTDTFIDVKGEYALNQDMRAIVDTPKNLEAINAALNNPRFLELSKYCCLISTGMFIDKYNKDILALFRKDFWKAFV